MFIPNLVVNPLADVEKAKNAKLSIREWKIFS